LNTEVPKARTIEQLCAAYNISRSQFYKIQKLGKGPRVVRDLGRPRILAADEAAWAATLGKSK
jgi:hypothetical protein